MTFWNETCADNMKVKGADGVGGGRKGGGIYGKGWNWVKC